jgi:hypothetical protein
MSWLSKILGSRRNREAILETVAVVVREAARGAQTIAEVRERLARHAQAGDLDKAIVALADSETLSREYIEKG